MVQGGFVGLLLLTILLSGGIWWWQHNQGYILIHSASIKGMGVNASVKVAGTVTDIMVKDGDTVEAGQTLAKIKIIVSPEQIQQLEQAVESAKLHYNEVLTRPATTMTTVTPGDSTKGDVAAAQAAVDKAVANKDRMDKLFEIGAVSAVQRNNATNAYQAAEEALNAASQGPTSSSVQVNNTEDAGQLLKLAKFQLEQAEMALAASSQVEQVTAVVAPVAGVINYTEVKVGDSIEAGQPIFTVGDAGNLWVEVQVDEKQIDKLKLGQFVSYSIENYPDKIFKGTVFEITSELSKEEGGGNGKLQGLPVKISLPVDTDFVFKSGMKVNLKIKTS